MAIILCRLIKKYSGLLIRKPLTYLLYMTMNPCLAILVPCYNEEEVFPHSSVVLLKLLQGLIEEGLISDTSYLCFINDGSRDQTWQQITDFAQRHSKHVKGICLSRNFGHQAALLVGYERMIADCYITIDADLQDDETVMRDMIQKFKEGKDIVYGVRRERNTDSFFKRTTALGFYKLMHFLGTRSVYNHADYRLMSQRAVKELARYGECHVFLRGLVTELGFPTASVFYDRKARELGESKYPLIKMLRFAWTGITSFSDTPMKLSLVLGFFVSAFATLLGMFALIVWLMGDTVSGWTSLALLILFFSGLQMFLLGIMGEYIGKIYMQSKHRPRYIVYEEINEH
jgi:glycosyltransferase involved in cell wall biosynthesis